MGNARAQGELQKGAIYGNMAQQLGRLPGQTMQFAEGMQSANQNQQMRKLQIESMQREAEFEKQAMSIVNNPSLTPEMKDVQMENLLRQHPDKWERYQNSREIRLLREQSAAEHFNAARQGKPGTVNPMQAGVEAQLPMPNRDMQGVGDFQPVVPLEAQRVHPTIKSPMGPLNAETDVDVSRRQEENAFSMGRAREQGKAAGKPAAALREPTPRNVTAVELYRQDPDAYKGMKETDEAARAKYRREPRDPSKPTAAQELKEKNTRLGIKKRKETRLEGLRREFIARDQPDALGKKNPMTSAEYQQKTEQIQREFLEDMQIAGFDVEETDQSAAPVAALPQAAAMSAHKAGAAPAAPAAPKRKITDQELIQQGYKKVNGGWELP